MSDEFVVNGLLLPPLLIKLIQGGKWRSPHQSVINEMFPYMLGPMSFDSIEKMRESTADHLEMLQICGTLYAENFCLARGSEMTVPLELPWLDIEKTVFIAGSEMIGDDVILGLDYRTNPNDPRIVISEWLSGAVWGELTPTFTEFAVRLGLI